jgi:transposase-like protein
LGAIYPIVWLDAIHYKIKENGRYVSKAIYTLLGLNIEGKKELLGLYLSDQEGTHHWLSVLTDLYNRGVKDILIACIDGLKGFPEAIESIYPDTEIQHCIIHQIRNSMKYVASKKQKACMADLKAVYKAATLNAAELALDDLEAKWGDKYPMVISLGGTSGPRSRPTSNTPTTCARRFTPPTRWEPYTASSASSPRPRAASPMRTAYSSCVYAGILKAL